MAIVISLVALICSLVDTQLAIEHFFSNEYLLIKMKPDAELIPHTHSYVSNCKFCGIIDTSWYAFDNEEKDNILTLIKYDLLREGMSGTTMDSLNLQKESDIILVTRKDKKLAKNEKFQIVTLLYRKP